MSQEWDEKLRRAAEECFALQTDEGLKEMKRRSSTSATTVAASSSGPASAVTSDGAFVLLFESPTALAEHRPSSFAFLANVAYRKILDDIGATFPSLNKRAADDVVTAVVFVQDSTLYYATFVHTNNHA